jgi:hypothetical protein
MVVFNETKQRAKMREGLEPYIAEAGRLELGLPCSRWWVVAVLAGMLPGFRGLEPGVDSPGRGSRVRKPLEGRLIGQADDVDEDVCVQDLGDGDAGEGWRRSEERRWVR